MDVKWVIVAYIVYMNLSDVSGHGRLIEPPARSSMWRLGFSTPVNYDDHALNCGGFSHQWTTMDGLCGICGDPWDQYPRRHEPPGLYATGKIGRMYRVGQLLRATVEITAHHRGWFEFRLCPNNNIYLAATPQCLDSYLLRMPNGNTRYQLPNLGGGLYYVYLQLPGGLGCSQCVLQWKWNAGNSWGCDKGGCCVGCGPQEQFYGCADISIGSIPATPPSTPTMAPVPSAASASSMCIAVAPYDTVTGMDQWCTTNCAAHYCPSSHCVCGHSITSRCRAVSPYGTVIGMNEWCITNCAGGYCPLSHCACA